MSLFEKTSKKGLDYIKGKYGVDVSSLADCTLEGLYSVYDRVCGEYNPPFVCKNMSTAVRNMKDSLKDAKQSIIAMHPEDYLLVEIGKFNKNTGAIIPISVDEMNFYALKLLFAPKEDVKEGDITDEIQDK